MTDGTPVEVDESINTDDLDSFENDFYSKSSPAPKQDDVPAEDTGAKEPEAPEEEIDEDVEADEAPADEDPVEEEDVLKPQPKKKQTAQERIAELTRARHDAERREADLSRRLAELEARNSQKTDEPKPQAQPQPVFDPETPNPNGLKADGSLVYPLGEFDPTFIRDLTVFLVNKENKTIEINRAEQDKASREHQAHQALQTEWAGKLSEVEKELPDLRSTIATLETELATVEPTLGTYLAQTIMSMEVGPKVLYYLANNVAEAQKIIAAGPVGATLALGRLEQKIQMSEAKKAAPPARVSNAPTPPVATRGVGSRNSVADDTDDLDAFEAKFFKRK